MSKQDGYASRTPADLERKYRFGETFAEVFGLVTDARKIAEEAQSAIEGLDQEQIFNLLTNNGKAQGIYRDDNGDVYVNASFIRSGTLSDEQLPSSVALKSEIPKALSELVNDKGFVEETGVTTIVKGVVTTDYVNALGLKVKAANITGTLTIGQLPSTVAKTSDIPTKTSQLTNNSGFVDSGTVTTITNNAIKTLTITAEQISGGTITGCRLQTVSDDMRLAITIDDNYIAFGDYASFATRTDGGIGVLADRGVLHLYGQDGVYIGTDGNTGNYWIAKEWGFELRGAYGELIGYISAEMY